jgi:hypothetical protein
MTAKKPWSNADVGLHSLPLSELWRPLSYLRRSPVAPMRTTADIEEIVLARLMVPDAPTPSQYFEGVHRDNPATLAIKRLMSAVLQDALRCLQTCTDASTPIRRRMFFEAQAWISDRRARGPFAFEAVCEALGIEPNRLREGIREWYRQPSSGMNSQRLMRRSVGRSVGPIGVPVARARRRMDERTRGAQ